MKAAFNYKLTNPPFGDPGLYVTLRFERRAFLFDLGDVAQLSPRELLAIEHVFISHTHLDHFIGFDQLLRVCVGRPLHIHLYGPPGFIAQVGHKLAAYTWNLVQNYTTDFTLTVIELHPNGEDLSASFHCKSGFQREDKPHPKRIDDVIYKDHRVCVRAVFLDHQILSIGFSIEEVRHVGVMKNHLGDLGFQAGPWLRRAKISAQALAPDDTPIQALKLDGTTGSISLGELTRRCFLIEPGPRIGYITDVVFSPDNIQKIIAFLKDASLLFIETSFRRAEHPRAAQRYHLTSHQGGWLARAANVHRVIPFHFSPKHLDEESELRAEVQAAFKGSTDHEDPTIPDD